MMKHILKLFVLAALCAALMFAAAAATETGSCGTGLTYTLDTETGVMTISGEGWLGQPQTKNKKAVRTLVIAEGVKNIQMSAFHGYTELRSVTLPTTLDFVASYAFAYCPRLEAVHISSLADFAEVWFDKADSNPLTAAHHLYLNGKLLTALNLPTGARQIGRYAFSGGTDFTSVYIPRSITNIAYGAFSGCEKLGDIRVDRRNTDYICEDNVLMSRDRETIVCAAPAAFSGTLTVPDETLSICEDAFRGCRGLTGVVPSDSTLYIGQNAFADTAWYDAQPDGVVYLGKIALVYKGKMPEDTEIALRDGTTAVADYAFAQVNLRSVRVPASLTNVGCGAFSFTILRSVYLADLAAWCRIEYGSRFGSYSHAAGGILWSGGSANEPTARTDLYLNGARITDLVIPEGITRIGSYTFAGSSIETVSIPDSVTEIEPVAFEGTSLATTFTDGVAYADKWAIAAENFAGDDEEGDAEVAHAAFALREDTVGIANGAFSWCGMEMEELVLPKHLRHIGDYACIGNTFGKLRFDAESELQTIGYGAFQNTGFTEVDLPQSLHSIGNFAFDGCDNLRTVIFRSKDCAFAKESAGEYNFFFPRSTVLCGYAGSTVEAYAKEAGNPFVALDRHTHVWGDITTDAPATCTTAGEQSRHCTVPGCTARSEVAPIPKLGHRGEFVIVREPTPDNPGEKRRTCTVCGAEEIRTTYVSTPGDVNNDGTVSKADLLRLQKYLAKWDVEIDEAAADCNGDGNVTKADLLRLQKYLAKWDVKLGK